MNEINLFHYFITSNVRAKLVKIFCKYPSSPVHLRALARAINEDPGNVSRELKGLEEIGFVTAKMRGNKKEFLANTDFVIYKELQAIALKTEPKIILNQ